MANSPSHRFGQIIGDLLEELMQPQLQDFCDKRSLYLDKKGQRAARPGKKLTWTDKYGNSHDLDFVIEKGGSEKTIGRPLAFIEIAWRRYTKHSKNKVQEIQGAVLPIAEKHWNDKPFLGAVLAGVFTSTSISQMKSSGFEVTLFPYSTVVDAFKHLNIEAEFDESTDDNVFKKTVDQITALNNQERSILKSKLLESNKLLIKDFLDELAKTIDRQIDRVYVIPLHGQSHEFNLVHEAIKFVDSHNIEEVNGGPFREYEVIVKYNNGDKIEAIFKDKKRTISFLNYIEEGVGT